MKEFELNATYVDECITITYKIKEPGGYKNNWKLLEK